MVRFREVLKNRDFFFLWLGQIISQIGDRLGQMALIGLIYMQSPGSSIELAKILSFTILPVFLIGPVAGVYVDRWDRRRTMFLCDFLRTAMVLFIPLIIILRGPFSLIYLLIFLVFSVVSVVFFLQPKPEKTKAILIINNPKIIFLFFILNIVTRIMKYEV